jgi:hypothetical protein
MIMLEINYFDDDKNYITITKEIVPQRDGQVGRLKKMQIVSLRRQDDNSVSIYPSIYSDTAINIPVEALPLLVTALLKLQEHKE